MKQRLAAALSSAEARAVDKVDVEEEVFEEPDCCLIFYFPLPHIPAISELLEELRLFLSILSWTRIFASTCLIPQRLK